MVDNVAVDKDDMVNYILAQLDAIGIELDEETVRAVLDSETDYLINYVESEEED